MTISPSSTARVGQRGAAAARTARGSSGRAAARCGSPARRRRRRGTRCSGSRPTSARRAAPSVVGRSRTSFASIGDTGGVDGELHAPASLPASRRPSASASSSSLTGRRGCRRSTTPRPQSLGTDREPHGHAEQVGVGELHTRARVPVVEEHLHTGGGRARRRACSAAAQHLRRARRPCPAARRGATSYGASDRRPRQPARRRGAPRRPRRRSGVTSRCP